MIAALRDHGRSSRCDGINCEGAELINQICVEVIFYTYVSTAFENVEAWLEGTYIKYF